MISIAENSRILFAIRNSMVVLGQVESILLMLRRSFIIAGVRSMGMIRMGGNRLRCKEGGKIFWGGKFWVLGGGWMGGGICVLMADFVSRG